MKKIMMTLALALAAWAPAATAFAYRGECPYFGGGPMFFGGGPMMMIFWILVIALVVLGIGWLWKNGGGFNLGGRDGDRAEPKAQKENPLEVLKRRYAEGEMDSETYQEMKRVLED